MSKIMIVAAGVAGYVLGTKAGHQRYEQIAAQARRVWKDPRVRERTSQVTDAIKDKAPQVKEHLPGRHASGTQANGSPARAGSTDPAGTADGNAGRAEP